MPRSQLSSLQHLLLFFSIFFLCIAFTKSASEIKTLPGIALDSQDEISQYLKKSDVTLLVFYYKTESEKAEEIAGNLKIVYSKLKYLIEIIKINCDNNHMEECTKTEDNLMDEEFYRIEVYMPPLYKYNPYTKEIQDPPDKRKYERRRYKPKYN